MKIARLAILLLGLPALAAAQLDRDKKPKDSETLFLDLSKVKLGAITTEEDKKKYLHTIQLEKARITRKTMKFVYEDAYQLYKSGDFEGTHELTSKMLTIDPGFEDAAILQRASVQLKGAGGPFLSERRLVQNKFDEGLSLYRQGRLVEAAERLEEAVKLSPLNLKARYWLKRVKKELAEEHFRRGQQAYQQHRLRDALDQWYAALVLNPRYPRLMSLVSKVEAELRQSEANDKLQNALQLYSQGRNEESLNALDDVLKVEPGDPKAQRLQSEIRAEIANQHVVEGRRLYTARKFNEAIAQWRTAAKFGYDGRAAEQLIARAKEQMRKEEEVKKRAADEARKKEEEEKKKEEEEAAKKAAQAAVQAAGGAGPIGQGASSPMASEENRRSAVQHWNAGIINYQKGEYEKARDEWMLCKQLDPSNSDCITGLQRIDQQFGGQ